MIRQGHLIAVLGILLIGCALTEFALGKLRDDGMTVAMEMATTLALTH